MLAPGNLLEITLNRNKLIAGMLLDLEKLEQKTWHTENKHCAPDNICSLGNFFLLQIF